MSEFERWLRYSDWHSACMDGMPAIDLNNIVAPQQAVSLSHFCYLTSLALAQAQDLVLGRYALHGAQGQRDWCFWGSLNPPRIDEGEFILRVTQLESGQAHYHMCVHGDIVVRRLVAQCLLYGGLSDGNGVWSTLSTGRENDTDIGYQQTIRFSFVAPVDTVVTSLHMLPVNLN